MVAEATSQIREQGFAPSAGIHRRQAWRPVGLRGVESILSGIATRSKSFASHRARLTAWYEQFVQRSQPLTGWQPLLTAPSEVPHSQASFGSAQSAERISRGEPSMISKDLRVTRPMSGPQEQMSAAPPHQFIEQPRRQEPFFLPRSITGSMHTADRSTPPSDRLVGDFSKPDEPKESAVEPVAPSTGKKTAESGALRAHPLEKRRLPASPAEQISIPPPPRDGEQSLARPAMQLAILRPLNTAAGTVKRIESRPLSSGNGTFLAQGTTDFGGAQRSPEAKLPAVQTRLVSSVSSLPRQEVRGGFPLSVNAEFRRDADTSSEDPVRVSVRDSSAVRPDGGPEPVSLPRPPQAKIPGPLALSTVTLPEVQIRLLRRDEPASATQSSGNNVGTGGRSTIQLPKPQPPVPAAPPPLDINAVADKVYQALQRRHQLERERRGLY